MITIEQKREALQEKINLAAARVNQALADNLAPYIVRARRNTLCVAYSDLAMLEAFVIIESR